MKEEPISLVDKAEQYLKTNTELYTLRATDKIASVVATLVTGLVIGGLAVLVFFLFTMGLAFWIGDMLGHDYMGFLIVGGGTAIITVILYVWRYKIIRKPLMDQIVEEILE